MSCTEIAQWIDAIGSLSAALVALSAVLYFEIIIANKRRREERSALIRAAMDEAILNEDFARHNVRTADYGWTFIHQRVSSCIQAFHTGTFDIDDETRTIIRGYIESVEHVNSMMRSVELVSLYRPDDAGSVRALRGTIKRYCSGEMDPQFDADAKSLLDHISKFRNELETKFKKELM